MRDIWFRGKRVKNGEWVQGSYVYAHKYFYTGEAGHLIFNIYGEDGILIDNKTLGQFTGLTDKNGTKIFEGDIVEYEDDFQYPESCENGIFMNRGVVEYSGHKFHFTNRNDVSMEDIIYEDEKGNMCVDGCYIIGNIHDNPELLEENT